MKKEGNMTYFKNLIFFAACLVMVMIAMQYIKIEVKHEFQYDRIPIRLEVPNYITLRNY